MDKYTTSEEVYKQGREDAIKRISDAISDSVSCVRCPADCCNDSCEEVLSAWMRGLFEEER